MTTGKSRSRRLYRVQFVNQGKVYEIYARGVSQGGLFGFIEVEDLVFGEKSAVLVDPTEDALKKEFEDTKRIFIPMHSVIRIDELEKTASLKARVIPLDSNTRTGQAPVLYTPTNPFG